MWPTFCHVTQGLISGLWWPREHAFQISDCGECDCLRAVEAALWSPLLRLHGAHASCGLLPDSHGAQGYIKAALCLGDVGLLWRLALAWGIFENLTKLSWDPNCSLLSFPQLPSLSRSPSLRLRLDPSLKALPAPLSSLTLPSQVSSLIHFLHA